MLSEKNIEILVKELMVRISDDLYSKGYTLDLLDMFELDYAQIKEFIASDMSDILNYDLVKLKEV